MNEAGSSDLAAPEPQPQALPAGAVSASTVAADVASAFERASAACSVQTDGHRIAGAGVSLRFASEPLRQRLRRAFAHLEEAPSTSPALEVNLWDSESTGVSAPPMPPARPGDPPGALYHFHDPPLRGVYQPGLGSLSVYDAEARRAWHWVESAAGVPYWDRACPIRQILFWWLGDSGCLQVHGAAIGTADAGVLVVGKGGSGKSTTALSSLGTELLYAGDDYVAVRSGASPRVESLYSSGKLEPDHVRTLLPHLVSLLDNADRLESEKAVVFVHDHFAGQTTAGFPLAAVLVPKLALDRRESRIVPTSRAAALAALAPSTILQLHTATSEALTTMSRLVARVPCHALEIGSDVGAIPPIISEFLAAQSR